MSSAAVTAAQQPLRIVSRRAQQLLQRRRARQGGDQSPNDGAAAAAKATPKQDAAPWPKSLRYTFYTVCVASIPFSIGQAIALSPRLREWMLSGDDAEVSSNDDGGFSARKIISLVRSYWGQEDYVPFVDRPKLKHVAPGHRNEWQEDNYSSLLKLFGLYTPKEEEASDSVDENSIPISLENEPPHNIRNDQTILSQYLSTKTNISGVKTQLTLIPCTDDVDEGNIDSIAGYETECTLPANTSMNTLRALCHGSDAQSIKRDLAESDPVFHSKYTNERLNTKSWNEDCRWVVTFADLEEDDSEGYADDLADSKSINLFNESHPTPSHDASKVFRHSTSIHSSWSYFPEFASTSSSPTALGSVAASLGSSNTASTTDASTSKYDTSTESLQIQKLQHQIATLERELKDPSSMRDRDGMYEELKLAKGELRSLKPWWRKFWG